MKKDTVKYENRLNDYSLRGFHAIDLDIFMLICSKVKERGTELLSFSFSELKQTVGMTRKSDSEFLQYLNRMSAKVKKINGAYKKKNQFFEFNLFGDFYGTTIEVTKDNSETQEAYDIYGEVPANTLLVSVNQKYAFLLNGMDQYTKFDLAEFVQLESKYSKNLYRLLKQFRNTGSYTENADRFRELIGCPKSYSNKEFMRTCVNVAVKELSQGYFEGLKVEPIRGTGRGRPIIKYQFTFKKSSQISGQRVIEGAEPDPKDKPRAKVRTQKKPKQTKFNNFSERDYNYNELESILTR